MNYLERVYHALGYEPPENSASVAKLDEIEDLLGRPLPPAVKEWYAKEMAVELMASRTSDRPVPVAELGQVIEKWYGGRPRDFLAEGYLFVMTENQGVCNWVIDLNSGDDPGILVEVNSSPNEVWQLYSPHFSEWIYTLITDWIPNDSSTLCAQAVPAAESDLEWLGEHMEPGLVTYTWPCPVNYRFARRDQRVIIWACDGQADWFLSAESEQSLSDLASRLWQLGNLSQSLYSTDDAGERVLQRLRAV